VKETTHYLFALVRMCFITTPLVRVVRVVNLSTWFAGSFKSSWKPLASSIVFFLVLLPPPSLPSLFKTSHYQEEQAAAEKAEKKARREAKKVADAEKAVKRAAREKLQALEAKAEARRDAVFKKRDRYVRERLYYSAILTAVTGRLFTYARVCPGNWSARIKR